MKKKSKRVATSPKELAATGKLWKKRKAANGSKLGVVNTKMSASDRKALQAKAKKFAQGNLSAWVRHAGKKYTPKKGEKISLKAA